MGVKQIAFAPIGGERPVKIKRIKGKTFEVTVHAYQRLVLVGNKAYIVDRFRHTKRTFEKGKEFEYMDEKYIQELNSLVGTKFKIDNECIIKL